MPNFDEHLLGGAIVGAVVLIIGLTGIDIALGTILVAAIFSALGSMLPDLIEPATSGYHRSLFHSFAMLFCLGFFTLVLLASVSTFGIGAIVTFVAVGYLSHLSMDAFTKASLPLIA